MKLIRNISSSFVTIIIILSTSSAFSSSFDLQEEINAYFAKLDSSFGRIAEAGVLRGTDLKAGERLFIRSMKKNIVYNTLLRVNSKGSVVTEAVRGRKVERPMRDVSDEKWFKWINERKEPYYSLIKEEEAGRYYLFWARPILKKGNRFIGGIAAKIDLWDCFHVISGSYYEPFLVRLGRKGLFSHKWEDERGGVEKNLTIQGIDRISVIYLPEKAQAASVNKDTAEKREATPKTDTIKATKADKSNKGKKGSSSAIMIFFLVIIIGGITVSSFMLIAWMKRRAFLKRLDEEEDDEDKT